MKSIHSVIAIVAMSLGLLTACEKPASSAGAQSVDTEQPQKNAKSAVSAEQLGLFAGAFDASSDEIRIKKEMDRYMDSREDYEGIMDLSEVPAQFKAYVYQDPLYGDYTIAGPNRLSIVLTGIYEDHTVAGYSVCAGNKRALTGKWTLDGTRYQLDLKEPGDDANDGVFAITFNPKEGFLKGNWQGKQGQNKTFALKHDSFKYNADAGDGYLQAIWQSEEETVKNPSTDLLQSKDVENLTRPQLRMLRNLIYARHGVSFANPQMRATFEAMDWYMPTTTDASVSFTELEVKNIEVLKRYESYATDTYNSYGR